MTTMTIDTAQLQQLIAAGVTAALQGRGKQAVQTAKGGNADTADRKQELESAVIRAFKRAGFKDNLKPRESIQTYNRWLAQGFKVKPGEKSIKVKQFRLFHVTQVEPIEQPAAEPKAIPSAPAKPKGNAGKSTLTLFPKEEQAKPSPEDKPAPPTAA